MSESGNIANINTETGELVLSRIIDAPREIVWKAWTEPEQLMKWWGPKHFSSPACKIDLRIGGKYHECMRSPEGNEFWSTGFYREIKAPERLVMTDSFADEHGNVVPGTHYGMGPEFPLEMLVTLTFEEYVDPLNHGPRHTKLLLRHSGTQALSSTDLGNMKQGWNESLDKLAVLLETGEVF
jgi:uncharacterized protein YndB with AHSA1/START domain